MRMERLAFSHAPSRNLRFPDTCPNHNPSFFLGYTATKAATTFVWYHDRKGRTLAIIGSVGVLVCCFGEEKKMALVNLVVSQSTRAIELPKRTP